MRDDLFVGNEMIYDLIGRMNALKLSADVLLNSLHKFNSYIRKSS